LSAPARDAAYIHMVLRELCIIKYLPSAFRRIDGTAQNIPLITIKEPTQAVPQPIFFVLS